MMPKLIFPIGPSGVGKSTYLDSEFPTAKTVSPDILRAKLVPQYQNSSEADFSYDSFFRRPVCSIKDEVVLQNIRDAFDIEPIETVSQLDTLIFNFSDKLNPLRNDMINHWGNYQDVIFDATNLGRKSRENVRKITRYSKTPVESIAILFTKPEGSPMRDYINEVLWRNYRRRWGSDDSIDLGRSTPKFIVLSMCKSALGIDEFKLIEEKYKDVVVVEIERTSDKERDKIFPNKFLKLVKEEEDRIHDPSYEGLIEKKRIILGL